MRTPSAFMIPLVCAAISIAPAVAKARPTVVELFTSEGCSSCPPADRLLTGLTGRADLLPLAFHVTYWNALGWRDPYSFEGATTRQARYASRLGGGSYTPEIVVDGRQGMVGSDREAVEASIAQARARQAAIPVRANRLGGEIHISLGASGERGRVLLVGYDPRHETAVGRGENSGRTLTESNVVRSLQTVGTYDGAATTLAAPVGAGADAVVLIQAPDGAIVGAARL